MSVSVYVKGIVERDDRYEDMVAIKRACDRQRVQYPDEVTEYFGDIDLDCEDPVVDISGATTGDVKYGDGMLIDIESIPDKVKKIRIYMR